MWAPLPAGLRIFGLAGIPSTGSLQTFVTPALWGRDLFNASVGSAAAFQTAVAALRAPAGHTPGSGTSANPPRWSAFEAYMLSNATNAPDGNSILGMIQAAQANGVEPLLVFTCAAADSVSPPARAGIALARASPSCAAAARAG